MRPHNATCAEEELPRASGFSVCLFVFTAENELENLKDKCQSPTMSETVLGGWPVPTYEEIDQAQENRHHLVLRTSPLFHAMA